MVPRWADYWATCICDVPFWIAAGLSLANAIYGFFILPESLPPERRAKKAWHMANPLGALTLLRSHPELGGLAIVTFLYYLAHQVLPTIFVLYADYRYGWSERTIGLSLATVGLSVSLASGLLVGPFVKRFGERYSLLSGLGFGFLAFLAFALASRGWMAFAAIPLIALWGIAGPCDAIADVPAGGSRLLKESCRAPSIVCERLPG